MGYKSLVMNQSSRLKNNSINLTVSLKCAQITEDPVGSQEIIRVGMHVHFFRN